MSRKNLIIFIDSGDTLIDESSEIRDTPGGIVLHADLIPGAEELLRELGERGYTVALVADGLTESFYRSYCPRFGKMPFDAVVTSEDVGEEKPSPRMFQRAMDLLGLTNEDKDRILMVGNNIERDVTGANRFGIRSALMTWSVRYRMEPETEEEVPDYRVKDPLSVLTLAEELESELKAYMF